MKKIIYTERNYMLRITIVVFIINLAILQLNAQTNISQPFTMLGSQDEKIELNLNIDKSISLQPFIDIKSISGLSITGELTLNSDTSLVRIILVDENSTEYLIYEAYSLLVEDLSIVFNQIGEETVLLNNVKPKVLKIQIIDASVNIKEVDISLSESFKAMSMNDIFTRQQQNKIERINKNIQKKGQLWIAGETSVSRMTYEEKKNLFGGKVPNLNGFEYYTGGIFVMSESDIEQSSSSTTLQAIEEESPYVDEFSWRDRHGEDWTSPVKSQGGCGSCWAFAAVAATEQLVNLYYNQHLDLDVSEQDVVSCSGGGSCDGGYYQIAFDYIASSGVVDENCFPYNSSDQPCSYKCTSAFELIKISKKETHSNINTDYLKSMIIKGPVCTTLPSWSHALNLVGYKIIKEGDKIIEDNHSSLIITIQQGDPLIGQTAWLYKNSWGTDWGESGYAFVVTERNLVCTLIKGPITSLNYSDSDIRCVDNDGDGYYNWGIGPKPAHCPDCPEEPDGDDTNPCLGPMNEYGIVSSITPIPKVDDVNILYGDPAPILHAEGQNIRWYNDAELTNLVFEGANFSTSETSIGSYSYFVTQSNSCESSPKKVTVSIFPPPPISNDTIFSENQENIFLLAQGENVKWYGNEVFPLIDKRDEQVYETVAIGEQIWMKKNLNYYSNTGSTYYNNDSIAYSDEYGRLYSWSIAKDACPQGWHLPSDYDWKSLERYIGMAEAELDILNTASSPTRGNGEGDLLKESGTVHWDNNNQGTDQYNFTALPGGFKPDVGPNYFNLGRAAHFWTSSKVNYTLALCRQVENSDLFRKDVTKGMMFSVRCISDVNNFHLLEEGYKFYPKENSPGIYTYFITQTINGLESQPDTVIVTIQQQTPPQPETENITSTEGETIPNLTASGQNIKWYSDAELTNLVHEGESFATGHTNAGIYTYYVTQTIDEESESAQVTLTIYPAPPVVNDVSVCENEVIPPLEASGTNIKWYQSNVSDKLIDERDGQEYPVVIIGEQAWMGKNLNFYTKAGSWYYDNDSSTNASTYGRLYNWETATNVCPSGWRLPSTNDWSEMREYLGGEDVAGGKLREAGTEHWLEPNAGATNESNFTGLPGGYRHYSTNNFNYKNRMAFFWFSTKVDEDNAVGCDLHYEFNGLEYTDFNTDYGFSVRCMKDFTVQEIASGNSYNVDNTTSGEYTYLATQTVSGLESKPAYITLNIEAIPDFELPDNFEICQGETQVLDAGSGFDSYLWSNGKTSQTIEVNETGTYSVTVSQGNCSNSDETSVTITPLPEIDLGGDYTICQGKTQILDAGSGFDSYLWSNGKTSQTIEVNQTGIYSVTVTQGNCSNSDETSLTVNPLPKVDLGGDYTICQDEIQILDAGSGFDSYSWSNGKTSQTIEVNQTGTYSVTVNKGSCSKNDEAIVTVIMPEAPITNDVSLCQGEPVPDLTAIGVGVKWYSDAALTKIVYSGNNFPTKQKAVGTYTYYASQTISGCESQAKSINLQILDLPALELGNDTTINTEQSISLKLDNPNYSYNWSNGSNLSSINIIGAEIGEGKHEFWLDITDQNNCTNSDTIFVTVKTSTNIEINEFANQVQIYPNPAHDIIFVNFNYEEINEFIMEITDLVGNKILSEKIFVDSQKKSSEIDISNLPNGLYVVEVIWLNYSISKKLIIE